MVRADLAKSKVTLAVPYPGDTDDYDFAPTLTLPRKGREDKSLPPLRGKARMVVSAVRQNHLDGVPVCADDSLQITMKLPSLLSYRNRNQDADAPHWL